MVNDPGEGAQAKRRAHAVIVDHLIPPMTRADSYGEIAELEQLMDEHAQVQPLDPGKLPGIRNGSGTLVRELEPGPWSRRRISARGLLRRSFVLHIDGYLCELKDAQIRGGLHVLGEPPEGAAARRPPVALTRRTNEGRAGRLRATLEEIAGAPGPERSWTRPTSAPGSWCAAPSS